MIFYLFVIKLFFPNLSYKELIKTFILTIIMIKTPLQEIIKDCTSKNMSCLEIQFTLCKLTCYLSESLEIKGPSLEK